MLNKKQQKQKTKNNKFIIRKTQSCADFLFGYYFPQLCFVFVYVYSFPLLFCSLFPSLSFPLLSFFLIFTLLLLPFFLLFLLLSSSSPSSLIECSRIWCTAQSIGQWQSSVFICLVRYRRPFSSFQQRTTNNEQQQN